MSCFFLQTGQKTCHDADGEQIPCTGSGQDAELAVGLRWPSPRFRVSSETALDLLTGLCWPLDATPAEIVMDWQSALDFVDRMNSEKAYGYADWRMPNRRELRSLIGHQTSRPALPEGHPFKNVFHGWYWTSTTTAVNRKFAWYIHMGGGRMFHGAKDYYYLLWPVRGEASQAIECVRPEPRFELEDDGDAVVDRLTGLCWMRLANLSGRPVAWEDALDAIKELNGQETSGQNGCGWHLPNINELESLVDLERHHPALSLEHPFRDYQEVYWSSTTSMFEPDWAWALYLDKGAVGVGRKRDARFHVWAVSGPAERPM